jgi:hypothetical protein
MADAGPILGSRNVSPKNEVFKSFHNNSS